MHNLMIGSDLECRDLRADDAAHQSATQLSVALMFRAMTFAISGNTQPRIVLEEIAAAQTTVRIALV